MKASRTKKRRRRRSNAQGRKIENNHKKEASSATLIIPPTHTHRPNRGLIDVYRLRHFSGGTSVIRSSLSLLAAPSSRCDGGGTKKNTRASARSRPPLSRHLKRSLPSSFFFFFFRLQLSYPPSPATCYPPGSYCIIRAAADWIRRAPPPFHPPTPASQQVSL